MRSLAKDSVRSELITANKSKTRVGRNGSWQDTTTATARSGWKASLWTGRDPNVHILTHAMHYASSVFEGERAYNGKIFESRSIPSGC